MELIKRINGGGSNCYLITNKEKSILIDTGRKNKRNSILKACEGYHIALIVLTHGHIDHVQNAIYLSKRLNAPVAVSKKDVALLKDNLCRTLKSTGILGNVVRFFSVLSAKFEKVETFEPDIFLENGDSLLKYGIDATVIELPGHTEGSIGIKVGKKDLIVGDALMHIIKPSVALLYENREKMILSAKKIQNFSEKTIYFGHGNPVMNRKWVN